MATRSSDRQPAGPEGSGATPPSGLAEIAVARSQQRPTRRATVEALEAILFEPVPVLDHGFVRVVDYMGDDGAIVQAARVSYGRGTKQLREDRGLIRYLMRHRHTTPFEMCEIKYHVKLPIFVARQWIRHRTANVNEYSARYSVLEDEFYIPAPQDLKAQATDNRQGRGEPLGSEAAERVLSILREDAARTYSHYEEMLELGPEGAPRDPAPAPGRKPRGLARELARMNLTANIYTQWYWKIDLHNLFNFISLRTDPHAQHEIAAYAQVLQDTVRRWVPLAAEAFEDYVAGGYRLSRAGLVVVQRLLAGEAVSPEESGLSPREWRELMTALGRSE